MATRHDTSYEEKLKEKPSLDELCEHVRVGTNWYKFGVLLKLDTTKLDAIEELNKDVDFKILKMFQLWLNTNPSATRKQIIDALRKDVMEGMTIASNYVLTLGGPPHATDINQKLDVIPEDNSSCEEYAIAIFNHHYGQLSQCLQDSISVAHILHEEEILSETLLEHIESTKSATERRAFLLSAICGAIHISHYNLKVFASVLLKFTDNVPLANAILNDYNRTFHQNQIGCQDKEPYYYNEADVLPTSPVIAAVSGEPTQNASILIPQAMGKTFNEIRGKCGRIFFKVRRAILNNPPPIKDIKILLQDCYTDLKSQLVHVNTIDEILDIVRDKCTLTDISYLETIVEELDIKEAKVHIQAYRISIEAFCTTVSVRLCLDENFRLSTTSSSLKCETATFILDWNPDDYILDDIRDVLSECFERLSKHVQINIIKKTNSIAVICTFPFSLATLLIAKAQETIDLIKKRELIKLTIGQCVLFVKNKRDEEIELIMAEGAKELMYQLKTYSALIQMKDFEIENYKKRLRKIEVSEEMICTNLLGTQPDNPHILKPHVPSDQRNHLFFYEENNTGPAVLTLDSDYCSQSLDVIPLSEEESQDMPTFSSKEDNGSVKFSNNTVILTSPSVEECNDVMSQLKSQHQMGKHWKITLKALSSDSLLVVLYYIKDSLVRVNTLDISDSPLDTRCVFELHHVLTYNRTIEVLWFYSSPLPPNYLQTITDAVFTNTTLKELLLWNDPTITNKDIPHICDIILLNTSLQRLSLNNCPNITEIREFSKVIEHNKTLTVLYVNGTYLRLE